MVYYVGRVSEPRLIHKSNYANILFVGRNMHGSVQMPLSCEHYDDWFVRLCKRMLAFFLSAYIFFLWTTAFAAGRELAQLTPTQYGSFFHFQSTPNVLFLLDEIKSGDSFELRRAIRSERIDLIVASSPGGAVFEALQISGIVHDNGISTYVPSGGNCASACSFVFFAGKNRMAIGALGVHQFYSSTEDEILGLSPSDATAVSQFTASEIIGFLNQYGTPPIRI